MNRSTQGVTKTGYALARRPSEETPDMTTRLVKRVKQEFQSGKQGRGRCHTRIINP